MAATRGGGAAAGPLTSRSRSPTRNPVSSTRLSGIHTPAPSGPAMAWTCNAKSVREASRSGRSLSGRVVAAVAQTVVTSGARPGTRAAAPVAIRVRESNTSEPGVGGGPPASRRKSRRLLIRAPT